MKTVIIATGCIRNSEAEFETCPRELMLLIDRPFIQRVVEDLIERGINEFDFILSHQPEQFKKLLGTGDRWGCKFTFHLAREADKPYKLLRSIVRNDENVLLVHGDRILNSPELNFDSETGSKPRIFVWNDDSTEEQSRSRWSGYAVLPKDVIAKIETDFDEERFERLLLDGKKWRKHFVEIAKPLNVLDYENLIESQELVLNKRTRLDGFNANEVEQGVWIARNVSLPPTVTVTAPVFIGENCRIGPHSEIGPNAVIGSNCLIDQECSVVNSIVASGSFLGEGLTVSESVVFNNKLVNTRLGIKLTVVDNVILGNLYDGDIRRWMWGVASQLLGLGLLLAASPVLLGVLVFLKLKGVRRVIRYRRVVRLPADLNEHSVRTFNQVYFYDGQTAGQASDRTTTLREFFLKFLPALVNLARGELSLVGVRPRTEDEIHELPADWRELYLGSKGGLISEAEIYYGANPTPDELYAAECFYAIRAGVIHDLNLVIRYIKRLCYNLISRSDGIAAKAVPESELYR